MVGRRTRQKLMDIAHFIEVYQNMSQLTSLIISGDKLIMRKSCPSVLLYVSSQTTQLISMKFGNKGFH